MSPESVPIGVLVLVERGQYRLQRHAALGAVAGMVLPHLGVHGACVHGTGGHRSSGRLGLLRAMPCGRRVAVRMAMLVAEVFVAVVSFSWA